MNHQLSIQIAKDHNRELQELRGHRFGDTPRAVSTTPSLLSRLLAGHTR